MPVSVSIAFQTDKPIGVYGALARVVEESGFDGVSLYNDLLYQPAWLPLLEMARHTSRLRIGPAAVNPFSSHPVNIAGNISLLNQAAPGRVYLGIARGAWLDFIGLKPAEPLQAIPEALSAIRHLLSRRREALQAKFFPLAGGDSLRWPGEDDAKIPFLLGSWGPRLIRACRDQVTEIKLGGTANPGAVAWLQAELRQAAEQTGIVVGAVTVVDEDGQAARALARRETALYLPVVAGLDPSLEIEPDRLARIRSAAGQFDFERAAADISDEILDRFAFAGSPREIIDQAMALVDAGAARIEFGTPHGLEARQGLRLLAGNVLPALK